MTEVEAIANSDEVLRRQVVVVWMRDDGPMSIAFRPTSKDERRLSTDRETVSPKESFEGYVDRVGHEPDSTWPIKVRTALEAHEVLDERIREAGRLGVVADGGIGGLHESHASIAFSESYGGQGNSAIRKADERIARRLCHEAKEAGFLYRPVGGAKT